MRADRLAPHGHRRKKSNMQLVRTALHLNICYLKRLAKSQRSMALGDSGGAASEPVAVFGPAFRHSSARCRMILYY